MFGFKNSVALRDHGSPHSRVDGIRIPLLCLNSEDDPFCPTIGMESYIDMCVVTSPNKHLICL